MSWVQRLPGGRCSQGHGGCCYVPGCRDNPCLSSSLWLHQLRRSSLPKVLPGHMPHSLTHQHGDMKAQCSPLSSGQPWRNILAATWELQYAPWEPCWYLGLCCSSNPSIGLSGPASCTSLPQKLILKVPLDKMICSSSPQSLFPKETNLRQRGCAGYQKRQGNPLSSRGHTNHGWIKLFIYTTMYQMALLSWEQWESTKTFMPKRYIIGSVFWKTWIKKEEKIVGQGRRNRSSLRYEVIIFLYVEDDSGYRELDLRHV